MKGQFHIIPHTHWDREWYLPFEKFRLRLVEMVDHLLEVLDDEPEFRFMLDGQTVVLEDYLEIRPENKARLKKYIKEGRLLIGPWYVLSDEHLVSGESLIRNLLLGHKIAESFGRVMKAGYLPDIFGHIAQMPQILRGFEIDNFIGFRGIKSKKSEFLWDAPDGSRVLAILLPDGYCNFHTLPDDLHLAVEEVAKAKRSLSPRSVTEHFLLMNGCDHLGPQSHLQWKVRELNKLLRKNKFLKKDKLILSTIPEYIRKIKKVTAELKIFRGELRNPVYRYVHSSGVLASRMYLKQENVEVETLLEKWVEPFSAFSWTLGETYQKSLIWQSWKYLLHNQAHDSICGCSIDEVHREMIGRFHKSKEIAGEIIQRNLNAITKRIDTSDLDEDETALVIFNPLNWNRREVVTTILEFPAGWAKDFSLRNAQGKEIYYQAEYRGRERKLFPSPDGAARKNPEILTTDRWEISFLAEDIPACGYKRYSLRPVKNRERKSGIKSIASEKNTLENEYLKVTIKDNGTLSVQDKGTGLIYEGCHLFEDGGDSGDLFDYSPPLEDKIITNSNLKAKSSLIRNGTIKATYKVEIKLNLPQSLVPDRRKRARKLIQCPVTSFITLAAKSRRIDIVTEVDNKARDHRLRILFPSGIKANFSYAESQFAVTKRKVRIPGNRNYKWEMPLGLHPQQSFLDVNDGKKGLTIANIGLPQYQVKDDGKGTIALTLLRSVGWFRQEALLTAKRTEGEARTPTPEAQCLGKHTFKYSIIPHSGNWERAKVYKEAHEHKVPLRGILTDKHTGILPEKMNFLSIKPDSLIISAIKKAESNNSLIVRCYNITNREIESVLKTYKPVKEARLVNLNEEMIRKLEIKSGCSVPLKIGKHQIATIKLTFR